MPRMTLPRIQPIAPGWRKEPFDHPDWLFDLKYDGFRAVCYVENGHCSFVSRRGNVFTRFDALCEQMASALCHEVMSELGVEDAILDGEVITADETGRPQFYDLLRRTRSPSYVAFDLLWLNGADLRPLPLRERRERLKTIPARGVADDRRGCFRRAQRPRPIRADVRARPRRHCCEAPSRSLRGARQVVEDQEPGVQPEGRPARSVQHAAAAA
jgi:ATP-dependent DNA ligase